MITDNSSSHRIPSNPSPKLSTYFTQWLFPHTAAILSMFLSQNLHSSSGFARCVILDLIGSYTSVNIANSRPVSCLTYRHNIEQLVTVWNFLMESYYGFWWCGGKQLEIDPLDPKMSQIHLVPVLRFAT
ncbi:hypothetical protein BOTCAL_0022g00230 [Botryotinia calthae]|uniref:Uncharacterized protein n=1 Tax=Botryotinia calthae TaxID=38488 RepID=A0A4Y8DEY5_9HELO|nr:hypothetical protein BOTCAL_0022g00230 [Botryotinia calthae]